MSIITDENALPDEHDITQYIIGGAGDLVNQGFARASSYDAGTTAQFSVHGDCTAITIYRIGHYDGNGWRRVTEIVNTPTIQPTPTTIANSNGARTCAAWSTTATWAIPSAHVSGLHIGVVRNAARNNGSWIPFVVRNDARQTDIVVGIPTATWAAAYNHFGDMTGILSGKNVYGSGVGLGNIVDRAFAVSLDRPVVSREQVQNHWDQYDLAVIDWLEENGYDVKYVASEDLHARPAVWNNSDIYISVGHDEYWSQEIRDNVETFRNAGGHCLFITANEVFWKTRYTDGERVMWCHKDTMPGPGGHVAGVPLDPVTWTGTWRDTRRPGGAEPESHLTGTFFRMNGVQWKSPVILSATYGAKPFWRGTSMQATNLTLTNAVGFEADEISVTDDRPYTILAAAVVPINGSYADNNGQNYNGNGSLNPWGIVMHQRTVGAGVVVGFGTMAWGWMLSDSHRTGAPVKNVPCQQAMVNLLKDLGVSAASLQPQLANPTAVPLSDYGMPTSLSTPTNIFAYDGKHLVPFLMDGAELRPLHRVT